MKLPDEKLEDAYNRADCVRAYRAWQRQKPKGVTLDQLAAGLGVSKRSMLRWNSLAGKPIDVAALVDLRTGRTGPQLAAVIEGWREYRADPHGAHKRAIDAARFTTDRRMSEAIQKLACVWAWSAYMERCTITDRSSFDNLLYLLRCEFPRLLVSRRSLFRWRSTYTESGVYGLVDRRGGDRTRKD
jgi:hypothetical protein